MYILVIEDRESYSPEAWGPFQSEALAEDYVNYLDPRPADEDVRVMVLNDVSDEPGAPKGACPECESTNVTVTPTCVQCNRCGFRHTGDDAPAILARG